jgi:hypothetical protein
MAHFRGTISGDKSNSATVSRLGHKRLYLSANGWDAGVQVDLYINEAGTDCATIWLNGGSNGQGHKVTLYDGPIDNRSRGDIIRAMPGNPYLTAAYKPDGFGGAYVQRGFIPTPSEA